MVRQKKNYKNFTKKKEVNPFLAGMHYLPLPALLVHVRPRVPERLAEEESMQWELKRKGTWLAFLNDVIVFSFLGAFVHILVLFSRKGCKSRQKELNGWKRRGEN